MLTKLKDYQATNNLSAYQSTKDNKIQQQNIALKNVQSAQGQLGGSVS